jgi:hypothetical protein
MLTMTGGASRGQVLKAIERIHRGQEDSVGKRLSQELQSQQLQSMAGIPASVCVDFKGLIRNTGANPQM